MPKSRRLIHSPLSILANLWNFLCALQQLLGHALSSTKTGWEGDIYEVSAMYRHWTNSWKITFFSWIAVITQFSLWIQKGGHICQELQSTASLEKQLKMTCQEILKLFYIHDTPKVRAVSCCGLIPALTLCWGSLRIGLADGCILSWSWLMLKFRLAKENKSLSDLYKDLKYGHNITVFCIFFYQQLIVFPLFSSENYKSYINAWTRSHPVSQQLAHLWNIIGFTLHTLEGVRNSEYN